MEIFSACEAGNLPLVKTLLRRDPSLLNKKDGKDIAVIVIATVLALLLVVGLCGAPSQQEKAGGRAHPQ